MPPGPERGPCHPGPGLRARADGSDGLHDRLSHGEARTRSSLLLHGPVPEWTRCGEPGALTFECALRHGKRTAGRGVARRMVPLSVLDLATVVSGSTPAQALADTTQHRRGRRAARLPPALGRRAPRHARGGQLRAGGAHRPPRERHHDPAGRFRRGHAAEPLAARRRGAVRDPRGAPPGRIDLGIGRAPGTDPGHRPGPAPGARTSTSTPSPTTSSSSSATSCRARVRRAIPRRFPAAGTSPRSGCSARRCSVPSSPGCSGCRSPSRTTSPRSTWTPRSSGTARRSLRRSCSPSRTRWSRSPCCARRKRRRRAGSPGPSALAILQLRSGKLGPLPTPEQAEAYEYSPAEAAVVAETTASHLVGDPETVGAGLLELQRRTDADEIMLSTRGALLRRAGALARAHRRGVGLESAAAAPRRALTSLEPASRPGPVPDRNVGADVERNPGFSERCSRAVRAITWVGTVRRGSTVRSECAPGRFVVRVGAEALASLALAGARRSGAEARSRPSRAGAGVDLGRGRAARRAAPAGRLVRGGAGGLGPLPGPLRRRRATFGAAPPPAPARRGAAGDGVRRTAVPLDAALRAPGGRSPRRYRSTRSASRPTPKQRCPGCTPRAPGSRVPALSARRARGVARVAGSSRPRVRACGGFASFALFLAVGAAWALASPINSGPDEPSHVVHAAVDSAW